MNKKCEIRSSEPLSGFFRILNTYLLLVFHTYLIPINDIHIDYYEKCHFYQVRSPSCQSDPSPARLLRRSHLRTPLGARQARPHQLDRPGWKHLCLDLRRINPFQLLVIQLYHILMVIRTQLYHILKVVQVQLFHILKVEFLGLEVSTIKNWDWSIIWLIFLRNCIPFLVFLWIYSSLKKLQRFGDFSNERSDNFERTLIERWA